MGHGEEWFAYPNLSQDMHHFTISEEDDLIDCLSNLTSLCFKFTFLSGMVACGLGVCCIGLIAYLGPGPGFSVLYIFSMCYTLISTSRISTIAKGTLGLFWTLMWEILVEAFYQYALETRGRRILGPASRPTVSLTATNALARGQRRHA